MTTQLLYSKEFLKHDNATHPENAQRLDAMQNELNKEAYFNEMQLVELNLLPHDKFHNLHCVQMI